MSVFSKASSRRASLVILAIAAAILTSCGGSASPARQADLGGLFPPLTVTVTHPGDWTVSLASSEPLAEVTLYFDNGDAESYAVSGLAQLVRSDNDGVLSYLRASTKGGDYWYFDSAGLWLPHGYRPKFGSSLGSRSASTVWVDGRQLAITCSDAYSQVKVYYNDDSSQVFNTDESTGMYNLAISSDNLAAVRITLAGDGSRYYYGPDGGELPAGTKWYEDAD
jgi:hypothetical protein